MIQMPLQPLSLPHLLIVDDDDRLRDLLCQFLRENDFCVSSAAHAGEAQQLLSLFYVDLIVLDIMMPGQDGLSFLSAFRLHHQTPVLLLSAKLETYDRIQGLERGADDYLPKPFSPRELLLRIQSILRRTKSEPELKKITFGPFVFDSIRGTLKENETSIPLSTTECSLLRVFTQRPGETLSRERLIELCDTPISPRTIDVQITRLRKKLGDSNTHYIQTVRNVGYVFWIEI